VNRSPRREAERLPFVLRFPQIGSLPVARGGRFADAIRIYFILHRWRAATR